MLAYISRYTHRVAISNRRLVSANETGVTFRFKDCRIEGLERYKIMTLAMGEFIRRILIHVLPEGFHRIRHYGLFANGNRADNLAKACELLAVSRPTDPPDGSVPGIPADPPVHSRPCPYCGSRMIIFETFERGRSPRYRPAAPAAMIRIDTS